MGDHSVINVLDPYHLLRMLARYPGVQWLPLLCIFMDCIHETLTIGLKSYLMSWTLVTILLYYLNNGRLYLSNSPLVE